MSDWEIKKPLGRCWGSDEEILPGEEYYASLAETEEGGFERRDFTVEYWNANQPSVFYFWKAKMQDPDQKKNIFIDDDMLMAFFDRLENTESQEKLNFRFVLCLILMRKRMLRYKSSELKDGQEVWSLKVTGQKREVEIINPRLTEEQIDELTENLGSILQIEIDEEND